MAINSKSGKGLQSLGYNCQTERDVLHNIAYNNSQMMLINNQLCDDISFKSGG